MTLTQNNTAPAQDLFGHIDQVAAQPKVVDTKGRSKDVDVILGKCLSWMEQTKSLLIMPKPVQIQALDLDGKEIPNPVPCDHHAETFLDAFLAKAYIILRGGPGTGKSTLPKMLAKFVGIQNDKVNWRVQGDSEASKEAMIGGINWLKSQQTGQTEVFFSSWPDSLVRFIDEVEKMPPTAHTFLLSMLEESQIWLEGHYKHVPRKFTVATMNTPDPGSGSWRLAVPFADRFDIQLDFPSPGMRGMVDILRNHLVSKKDLTNMIEQGITEQEVLLIQSVIDDMPVDDQALEALGAYVTFTMFCEKGAKDEGGTFPTCCKDCHLANSPQVPCSQFYPLTPRSALSVLRIAQARAFRLGHSKVLRQDIDAIMPLAFPHRITFPNVNPDNLARFAREKFVQVIRPAAESYFEQVSELRKAVSSVANSRTFQDNMTASANPFVREMAEELAEQMEGLRGDSRMGLPYLPIDKIKSLRATLDTSTEEDELIEDILRARRYVYLDIDSRLLDDEEFRGLFQSEDGVPFASDAVWEQISAEGRAKGATKDEMAVTIEFKHKTGILSLCFDQPESADEFRARIAAPAEDFEAKILDCFAVKGLTQQLIDAGFLDSQEG